jgi:hypothetical protein
MIGRLIVAQQALRGIDNADIPYRVYHLPRDLAALAHTKASSGGCAFRTGGLRLQFWDCTIVCGYTTWQCLVCLVASFAGDPTYRVP